MTSIDDATAMRMKDEVRRGWTAESAGWVKHADLLAAWSSAAVDLVVRGSGARPGMRALDVASASGATAFALARAVSPGGSVVATDLVPEMLRGAEALARARGVTNVTFREADAEALPFPDASFDVATCLHGVMFFPQPVKAAHELRRVLAPGGRAAWLAWGPPEGNPFLGAVAGPFLRRIGAAGAPSPDEPGPFRFAAPGSLSAVLRGGGFDDVREDAREIPWDFPGTPETFWSAVQEISSSLFEWFRADLPPAEFDAACREVREAAAKRYDGEKVRFTATMVLATGTRPA